MINHRTRLWSQDDYFPLFDSETSEISVEAFMAGHDWLHLTVDYGIGWRYRWAGRIGWKDGELHRWPASAFLKYLIAPANPALGGLQ